MITFTIPTWNRADLLRRCVESIAAQRPEGLIILDNASTDHTPSVCAELFTKHPWITVIRREDHVEGIENIKRVVLASTDEYTWTFGDDDILLPGALDFVRQMMQSIPCDFYHVAESKRMGTNGAAHGTMLDLCNSIGWIDFTGFISCNIARTTVMQQGFNSRHWLTYTRSAYPHSLAMLECMSNRPALMIQCACVESADETPETLKRWNEADTSWRYIYIALGLKLLQEDGILPAKLPEVFFRYLDGSMFGRAMVNFIDRSTSLEKSVSTEDWECYLTMAGMVEGPRGEEIIWWITDVRAQAAAKQEELLMFKRAYDSLKACTDNIQMPIYPRSYLPEENS